MTADAGPVTAPAASPAASPVRVLLADSAPLHRAGLRTVLTAADGLVVAGEAGDGAEAVELARRLLPDVLVIDAALPRLDGVAATAAIRAAVLPVRVLMLSADDSDDLVARAVAAGATGFLGKDAPAGELVAAVAAVAAGGAVVAPRILVRLAGSLPGPAGLGPARSGSGPRSGSGNAGSGPAPAAAAALAALTDREAEVLAQMARGQTNAEIARALTVSETTVKTHVGHLLTKLGLRDRVQAVVLAYESGLVTPGHKGQP